MSCVDLAIVGGGLAGLVAANRAAELGCSAVLLEAGSKEKYAANSRYAGGVFHLAFQDIKSDPESLERAIAEACPACAIPHWRLRSQPTAHASSIGWLGMARSSGGAASIRS